jgi:hypothetical protein
LATEEELEILSEAVSEGPLGKHSQEELVTLLENMTLRPLLPGEKLLEKLPMKQLPEQKFLEQRPDENMLQEIPSEGLGELPECPDVQLHVSKECPEEDLLKQLPKQECPEKLLADKLLQEQADEELPKELLQEKAARMMEESEIPKELLDQERPQELPKEVSSDKSQPEEEMTMPPKCRQGAAIRASGGELASDQIPHCEAAAESARAGRPATGTGDGQGRHKKRKLMDCEGFAQSFKQRLVIAETQFQTVPANGGHWPEQATEWYWHEVQDAARGRTYTSDNKAVLWAQVEKRSGGQRANVCLKFQEEGLSVAQLASVSMAGPTSAVNTRALLFTAHAFSVMASLAGKYTMDQLLYFNVADMWRLELVPLAREYVDSVPAEPAQ